MSGQLKRRWTGAWGNGMVSGDIADGARSFQLSRQTPWLAGVSCYGQPGDLGSTDFATKSCEHGQTSPVLG